MHTHPRRNTHTHSRTMRADKRSSSSALSEYDRHASGRARRSGRTGGRGGRGYRIFFRARSSVSLTERRTSFVFIELRENDGPWRARAAPRHVRIQASPPRSSLHVGQAPSTQELCTRRCGAPSRRNSESFRTPTDAAGRALPSFVT